MKEQLISFETAKLAKERGFDLAVNNYFIIMDDNIIEDNGDGDIEYICLNHNKYDNYYSRPTQSLLQKWLREVHNIHIEISVGNDIEYGVIYGKAESPEWIRDIEGIDVIFYKTYEEALEAGLQEALKLI